MTPPAPAPRFLRDRFGRIVRNVYGVPIRQPPNIELADLELLGRILRGAESWQQLEVLSMFRQGGPLDFQRRGGHIHKEYIDFATVAIGAFSAAMGWKIDDILNIQDEYAKHRSHFGKAPMSHRWPHLAARNVYNTVIGYELYESGVVVSAPPERTHREAEHGQPSARPGMAR